MGPLRFAGTPRGRRVAPGDAGGDRGLAVRDDLWVLWDADDGHLSGRAGAAADVRAPDRGAAELPARAASRRVRAAGRAVSGRVRAPDQPGRGRERPAAAGRTGPAD